MDYDKVRELIKFDESGKGDITLLLENGDILRDIFIDLIAPFFDICVDKIAGLEARGFVFAGALATVAGIGLVLVRKGGKIPFNTIQADCVDYSGQKKCLEISRDAIKKGDRVLIIDDWLETGNQLKIAIRLIEELGGVVAGIAVVIDQATPEARQLVSGYKYRYLIKMPKRAVT